MPKTNAKFDLLVHLAAQPTSKESEKSARTDGYKRKRTGSHTSVTVVVKQSGKSHQSTVSSDPKDPRSN